MTASPAYRVDWYAAGTSTPAAADATLADRYLVRLQDGCHMSLPLTPLPDGQRAVALLMANQTSFAVEGHIATRLAGLALASAPHAIVGVPTLGLTYARSVAESIGLPDFVALGYSRKFWYDEALSEPTVSSTSPDQSKRIYLDPSLLERIRGRRVAIVDDVLNTGATMSAVIRLLHKAQADIAAIVAVLSEGWQWQAALARIDPALVARVRVLGHIPLFARAGAGWAPVPETEAGARPAL